MAQISRYFRCILICLCLVGLEACDLNSRQQPFATVIIPVDEITETPTAVVQTQEMLETLVLTATATLTPTLTATGTISPTIDPASLPSPTEIETWTATRPVVKDKPARREKRIESEGPT
ncbi:MAG: hypothetical protein B6D39_00465 [Anaerolineae bacterium UTCFX2]|nr:hypothetical protein [Anaerolineales bacterium]OQY94938.1 MAG: hypothetical protein B6D39_00465 [Anaerolineae bacterium UTCFX2]